MNVRFWLVFVSLVEFVIILMVFIIVFVYYIGEGIIAKLVSLVIYND